jgi:hypothetical protein
MLLMPCNQCRHRKACDFRKAKRQLLKGSGLTVAKFSCSIMKNEYRIGRRVEVLLMCPMHDDSVEAAFLGTVMGWKARKVLVHLDTGESHDGYESNKRIVTAWPKFVRALDEPDFDFCDSCKLPVGAVVDDWACGCQPGWKFTKNEWGVSYERAGVMPSTGAGN